VLAFLQELRDAGVHHVILNFKYARRHASEILEEFGAEILPRLKTSVAQVELAHS
jgi:hypothetical protein